MKYEINMTGEQHKKIHSNLFSCDNSNNVSVVLCGRCSSSSINRLLVHEIHNFPFSKSTVDSTQSLVALFERAAKKNEFLVKISADYFELADNKDFLNQNTSFHAKLQMGKDGMLRGNIRQNDSQQVLSTVRIIGDDICLWYPEQEKRAVLPEFAKRHIQLFGQGTYEKLNKLKIAVVGCSGTGSPVIEQLARLGVGTLVLVDTDYIEEKNVNRILNSSIRDARLKTPKVRLLEKAIKRMGLGTKVEVYNDELSNPDVVRTVAGCDVVFGCMDSVDGRHLLNRIATFYLLPYFDIGIKLIADGNGGIDQVCGTIHYIQPGGSSLLSRRVYSHDQLFAANLKRTDANEYHERVKSKYIEGIDEDRPAVISVNMLFAAFAVNEFLARIHPFRDDHNSDYSTIRFSLTQGVFYKENESVPCMALKKHVGRGDIRPLLDMPQLSEEMI